MDASHLLHPPCARYSVHFNSDDMLPFEFQMVLAEAILFLAGLSVSTGNSI